ncbi:MAG: hypothetical protein ACE5IF_01950 [Candidatus Bathyarchaeia archaeon]
MQVSKDLTITVTEAPPPGNAVLAGRVSWWIFGVGGVAVELDGYKTETDGSGSFQLTVPVGTYTLKAGHWLFDPHEETLDLPEEKTYEVAVGLGLKLWVKIAAAGGSGIIIYKVVKPKYV